MKKESFWCLYHAFMKFIHEKGLIWNLVVFWTRKLLWIYFFHSIYLFISVWIVDQFMKKRIHFSDTVYIIYYVIYSFIVQRLRFCWFLDFDIFHVVIYVNICCPIGWATWGRSWILERMTLNHSLTYRRQVIMPSNPARFLDLVRMIII